MKAASARVTSGPARSAPTLNRMIMANMLRTKFSLKAEKNWLQNSGAKRRVTSSSRIMRGLRLRGG